MTGDPQQEPRAERSCGTAFLEFPDPVGVARRGWCIGSHEPLQSAIYLHGDSDHQRPWI